MKTKEEMLTDINLSIEINSFAIPIPLGVG